jgi:multidrug efflux pump subunit AcrB
LQGDTADEIQVDAESYEIEVRLRDDNRDSLADLSSFRFVLPDGKQVPLEAVAEIQTERGWSRISRINGQRSVTIRGDVDTRLANTAAIIGQFEDGFLADYAAENPRLRISIEGESKESAKTRASIWRAMLIGVLGVFVLLSFQFRSYIEPLVVMAAIPFALIGVIGGHLLLGLDISMPSLLGFVSLAGVVVNDSILLVLFVKLARDEGNNIERSAAQASRQRFRAIIITSLTTIVGLLPLIAEQSLQAQVLIPLAVSIAFGLMASTVLVLLVIPCLYVILADLGLAESGKRETPQSVSQE